MNKLRNYFTIFLYFTCFFLLFKYNYILNKSVLDAIHLWLNKVFPSLFITFILSDIIINTNTIHEFLQFLNKPFNKIFKTNGDAALTFFLSFISGTPASAYIIKSMLEQNKIDKLTANKLISYTYFSNPLFLYNILIQTFEQNITFKIIITHYLANIIIAIFKRNEYNIKLENIYNSQNKNILNIIPQSIKNSLDTMLMIFGTITFYMIITNISLEIFPLKEINTIIFKGLLEITQSLNMLNNINSIGIIKEIIAISIISFGGLSIHTQVYNIISDTDISYKHFFKGRILHVLISTITYLLIP